MLCELVPRPRTEHECPTRLRTRKVLQFVRDHTGWFLSVPGAPADCALDNVRNIQQRLMCMCIPIAKCLL